MNAVGHEASLTEAGFQEWGDVALAAQAAGSLSEAWKLFIKTKFYVAILRSPDDDPKNYLLQLSGDPDLALPTLRIAEVRERLGAQQGDGVVALTGVEIVRRVEDGACIEVLLREGVFAISAKRTIWLRSGVKVALGRVATRRSLRAAAPAAPLPVLAPAAENLAVGLPDDGLDDELHEAAPGPASLAARYRKPAIAAAVVLVAGTALFMLGTAHKAPVVVPRAFEAPLPSRTVVAPSPPGAPAVPDPVVVFAPQNSGFSVSLPGMAEELELPPDQARRLRDFRTNQYRLLYQGRLYTIEATDYLSRAPQNPGAEADVVQQSIIGSDGTLVRATPLAIRGAVGREVRVSLAGGGERAARFVFVGSKFIVVMVSVPNGKQASAHIDSFLQSFQLH
ncbi:MAG: hypothetical protein ACJ8GW_13720 [Massilia sp.]